MKKNREFWLLVGSQFLYGDEVLKTVESRAKEMSEWLSKDGRLPYKLVFKTVAKTNADIARREKEAELKEKEIAIKERELDAEIKKQADALKYKSEKQAEADLIKRQREADARQYEALRAAEAKKAEAEALRYAMEQEAEGIRAKGIAEAEAIEKKAEAQKKMGEASVLEMYLTALPEVVKNAASPLAQTDKIVMYGDGNSSKLVRDVMSSTSQIVEGMKESTGIDLATLLAGFVGGKAAANTEEK